MIHVAVLPDLVDTVGGPNRTWGIESCRVIVVDTLRASTTIITALENGARAVVPVSSIPEAFTEAGRRGAGQVLLAGERGGVRIDRFDLGNSPSEFSPRHVHGKTVIMATSNGTGAIRHCADARSVAIGSLLNARSVAENHVTSVGAEPSQGQDRAIIVCAGTEGEVSQDDLIGAGSIVDQMLALNAELDLDDAGLSALDLYLAHRKDVEGALARTAHGRRLLSLGFREDVTRAAQLHSSTIVPMLRDGEIRIDSNSPGPGQAPADTGT